MIICPRTRRWRVPPSWHITPNLPPALAILCLGTNEEWCLRVPQTRSALSWPTGPSTHRSTATATPPGPSSRHQSALIMQHSALGVLQRASTVPGCEGNIFYGVVGLFLCIIGHFICLSLLKWQAPELESRVPGDLALALSLTLTLTLTMIQP